MTQSATDYSDVNDNGLLDLDVYFDFTCEWSWQAAKWVCMISDLMGSDVMSVRWRFFSKQQNKQSQKNPDYKDWEQSPGDQNKGLRLFMAGGAAHTKGGEAALWKFYQAIGKLQFDEGEPAWEQRYIEQAWQETGLDMSVLQAALDGSDRSGLEKLERDHNYALEKFGIFGTPTLVFEDHRAFFFKLMPCPEEIDEALELFSHIQRMAMGFGGAVHEFKRPMTQAQKDELDEMLKPGRKTTA